MGQTVVLYELVGVSKAKTAKALLFLDTRTNKESWIPLRVASVKFINKEFGVKVSVPSWFYGKIVWKDPVAYTPAPKAVPANPYIGMDIGNMMEEKMILEEIYDTVVERGDIEDKINIENKLRMIAEACA